MKLFGSIPILLLLIGAIYSADCAYFFYGIGCPHCARAEPVIKGLELGGVEIYEFEVYQNSTNALLLNSFFDAYNVSQHSRGVPALFYSEGYMIGDRPIIEKAPNLFSSKGSMPCPTPGEINGEVAISSEASPASRMTTPELILFVGGAAFVDSINPCAIAVLLILLSSLMLVGEQRRVFKVGLAFIASVYISYYLFGLGLFSALQIAEVTDIVYDVVGFLAIALGILNIKDYFWYGGGGFVMEIPRSWRPTLKKILQSVVSVPGAFLIGFVVCLFELPCTGGPYFFTLGLLASQMSLEGILPILAFYNLIFVAPLVLILLLVNYGRTTLGKLDEFKEKNLRNLHLVAGIVMLILGAALILHVI
jgi:cytochrome c biogenesis protein CcdA